MQYYMYIDKSYLNYMELCLYIDTTIKFTGQIKIINHIYEIPEPKIPYFILRDDFRLLIMDINLQDTPINILDIYQALTRRVTKQNLKNELLVDLISAKNKKHNNYTVYDITAGFGNDAYIMALVVKNVILIEQNPMLATILYYVINVIKIFPDNITIICDDNQNVLSKLTQNPDIIYFDPMFNYKHKAKPKKNMQLLYNIIQFDVDKLDIESINAHNEQILILAKTLIKNKLIVKRDNKQQSIIENIKPSYSKLASKVRYDIYLK